MLQDGTQRPGADPRWPQSRGRGRCARHLLPLLRAALGQVTSDGPSRARLWHPQHRIPVPNPPGTHYTFAEVTVVTSAPNSSVPLGWASPSGVLVCTSVKCRVAPSRLAATSGPALTRCCRGMLSVDGPGAGTGKGRGGLSPGFSDPLGVRVTHLQGQTGTSPDGPHSTGLTRALLCGLTVAAPAQLGLQGPRKLLLPPSQKCWPQGDCRPR